MFRFFITLLGIFFVESSSDNSLEPARASDFIRSVSDSCQMSFQEMPSMNLPLSFPTNYYVDSFLSQSPAGCAHERNLTWSAVQSDGRELPLGTYFDQEKHAFFLAMSEPMQYIFIVKVQDEATRESIEGRVMINSFEICGKNPRLRRFLSFNFNVISLVTLFSSFLVTYTTIKVCNSSRCNLLTKNKELLDDIKLQFTSQTTENPSLTDSEELSAEIKL